MRAQITAHCLPLSTHPPFFSYNSPQAACFVRVPTEVIKQRMQTKQFSTTTAAVKSVIHNEGVLGFYRGYFSTVAREVDTHFLTDLSFPLAVGPQKASNQTYVPFSSRSHSPAFSSHCTNT